MITSNHVLAAALVLALSGCAALASSPAARTKAKAANPATKTSAKIVKPGAAPVARVPRPCHAPDAYFVLQKELGAALLAGDLEKAEQAARAQMLLRPDRALPYYNLATVDSLRGHREAAIEHLTRALDRGFAFPDLMAGDPDLAALRDHPLWPQLLARATSVHQAQLVPAGPTTELAHELARASTPATP